MIESRPGLIVFSVPPTDAFNDEAGGHRWQRVPPTEKRGRMQTSTITVAVLPEPTATQLVIADKDLEITTCRASGNGGQHLQKTNSAVQVKHKPSGLIVRCEDERSQHTNRARALAVLRARLWDRQRQAQQASDAAKHKAQIGSGMRGDKRRTIRSQDDSVVDHVTGRTWRLKDYERGEW